MHARKLLHSLLDKACKSIDKRLRTILFSAAETLIFCKQLSIANLGRSLQRSAKVKHKIKCIDRLFGNERLHRQRKYFYKSMAGLLVSGNKRPVIIVDWSGLTPCGNYYFLSASLAVNGRALTLYENAYPLKEYVSQRTHRQFLKTLYEILPKDCIPIIITDAGFRNTWFKRVIGMKWDFIGRVRNKTQYREKDKEVWIPIKALYKQATLKARYMGQVVLSKSNPLLSHFYLMKQRKKHRIKKNLAGKKVQCSSSKKHAKSAKEPWLVASSLSPEEWSAIEVMLIYKKRMQIEETFRDLKNTRNGLGLRHCRSFNANRLNVALLIAALAMVALWLFGIAAKQKGIHYSFQSNTEKRRNILSNFIIGWQVLIEGEIQFRKKELMDALAFISSSAVWDIKC
jgi:hypothetical protein